MKLNLIETKEILDLEQEIGYELIANENPINAKSPARLSKFHISFEKGDIMEGGCLISDCGRGNTVDEALKDYCKIISCKRLAFDAYTPKRKEIQFPKLIHTKLVGY